VVSLAIAAPLRARAADASAGDAAPGAHDLDAIDRSGKAAYDHGSYAFCTQPDTPLGSRQRELCGLASEIDGCEGLQKACAAAQAPKDTSWLERLARWTRPSRRGSCTCSSWA
jgi:hypothetical protein